MKQAKWFLLLHVILGIYAGSSVCSKLAAQQPFLSAASAADDGLREQGRHRGVGHSAGSGRFW